MEGQTDKDKVFLNIVQSDQIAEPTKQVTAKGDCWSLPYSVGPPHMEKDKKGDNAACFDCCFHSRALQLGSAPQFKSLLVNTAIDGVEEAFKRQGMKVTLDREYHIVKGVSYKEGRVPTMLVAVSAKENWKGTSSTPASTASSPASTVGKKEPVSSGKSRGSTAAGSDDSNAVSAASSSPPPPSVPSSSSVSKTKIIRHEAGAMLRKGFLNAAANAGVSLYPDKIPTVRPRGGPHAPTLPLDGESDAPSAVSGAKVSLLDGTALMPPVRGSSDNMGMKAVSSRPRHAPPSSNDVGDDEPPTLTTTTQEGAVSNGIGAPAVPRVITKHREEASLGDFNLASSATNTPTINRPKELVYEIQLPMVTVPSKIVLDVSERRLCLRYLDTYALDMPLPYKVFDKKGRAAFDKSKKALVVTLPVEPASFAPAPADSSVTVTNGLVQEVPGSAGVVKEEEVSSPTKATSPTKRSSVSKAGASAEHGRWVQPDTNAAPPAVMTAAGAEDGLQKVKEMVQKMKEDPASYSLEAALADYSQEVAKLHAEARTAMAAVAPPPSLADEGPKKEYISAVKFIGRRPGYVFRMGDQGLGYYLDTFKVTAKSPSAAATAAAGSEAAPAVGKKRVDTVSKLRLPDCSEEYNAIPYRVQQNQNAIAFLFDVANVLADSVQVQVKEYEVTVRFQALENVLQGIATHSSGGDVGTVNKVFDKRQYGMIFTLKPEACNEGFKVDGMHYDIASKNMVLMVMKRCKDALWRSTAIVLAAEVAADGEEMAPAPAAEEFSPAAWVTAAVLASPPAVTTTATASTTSSDATTVDATEAKAEGGEEQTVNEIEAAIESTTPAIRALLSSMKFATDLVSELD